MHRPWASSKMPSPHESSNLPVLSKTMYGCSARVKTWTLSFESTATAPTWPHTQPEGSSPQPRTSSYWRSPASTTMRSLIVVMAHLSRISGQDSDWVTSLVAAVAAAIRTTAQHHRRQRSVDVLAEIDDPDAFERAWHAPPYATRAARLSG